MENDIYKAAICLHILKEWHLQNKNVIIVIYFDYMSNSR